MFSVRENVPEQHMQTEFVFIRVFLVKAFKKKDQLSWIPWFFKWTPWDVFFLSFFDSQFLNGSI